jgi:hypothetical protein
LHPSVLGGLGDPTTRYFLRNFAGMTGGSPAGAGRTGVLPLQPYLPSWRQMLALEILRREAEALIGRPAPDVERPATGSVR